MPDEAEELYHSDCPGRVILDQIADKWSVIILAVCDKPRRFNEIRRVIEGITQKALTQTLRRLERNGLVARRVIPISPIAVEYSLTPLGRTLKKPFAVLYAWTIEHQAEIEKAQKAFDAGTSNAASSSGSQEAKRPRLTATKQRR